MTHCTALTALLMTLSAMTSATAAMTVVDMTFVLDHTAVFWPGNPPFNFTILSRGQNPGYWYESGAFFTPEHGGTHADAPAHFYKGGWRVEQIPASHLIGPAVVIDTKAQAAANASYLLTPGDILDWEEMHGKVPAGAVVLMNNGWASRYPNASRVFNSATPNVPSTFRFPGIHPDAATFLTEQRDVIAVGVDTPSTDYGESTTFPTHVILGRHNVIGLENVANMDSVPARGATIFIGLVKLGDGSGGPARILAVIQEEATGSAVTSRGSIALVVVLGLAAVTSYLRLLL